MLNPLEDEDWLFPWLADTAGDRSLSAVALLRRNGGNRLELDEFANALGRHGIDAFESSPSDVSFDGRTVRLMGRTLQVGYLELGMQDALGMWPRLVDFISAVRQDCPAGQTISQRRFASRAGRRCTNFMAYLVVRPSSYNEA